MKKYLTLLIILCLTITLTGCAKGKKSIKTLTCEYDMSNEVTGFDKTQLTIEFKQDTTNFKIVSGNVTFAVKSSGMSSSQANSIKSSFEEEFCKEGFFGEGTNKSCKVTIDNQSVTANIEIDPDKFIKEIGEDEFTEGTLDELKEFLEEEFSSEEISCKVK
jgi:hypothetical protein